jgi:hypothetical protein
MKFDCEYTITIKLNDVYIHTEHSSDELRDKIMSQGKKQIMQYLSGNLFDPEKKIIFEDTSFKLKKI